MLNSDAKRFKFAFLILLAIHPPVGYLTHDIQAEVRKSAKSKRTRHASGLSFGKVGLFNFRRQNGFVCPEITAARRHPVRVAAV